MHKVIGRQEVRRLIQESAQIVEVLPREEYEEEHLPGAVNIPVTDLDARSAARLRKDRPVVVYCHDLQWDMSPRAAWRLETLGFREIYEYSAGKSDWGAYGLPLEGKVTQTARIKDVARADVPTCGIDETVGAARERASGWDTCMVVNEERVVLGRMFKTELDGDPMAHVGDVMRPGPSTFRPNVSALEMLEYMDRNRLETAPVTTSDGRLVGLVMRADAERAAHPG